MSRRPGVSPQQPLTSPHNRFRSPGSARAQTPIEENSSPSRRLRRSYSPQEQVAIIDAVHAALVTAFKIPRDDRSIRLATFEPHAMVNGLEPGVADRYTRVTIDCFSGRSIEAKRNLYRAIVEHLEPLGIKSENVSILLREAPVENWGAGGVAACDQDLGFTVEV